MMATDRSSVAAKDMMFLSGVRLRKVARARVLYPMLWGLEPNEAVMQHRPTAPQPASEACTYDTSYSA